MDAPFINEPFQNVAFKQVDLADIAEVDSLVRNADVVVRCSEIHVWHLMQLSPSA
jgi:hypothetical protein